MSALDKAVWNIEYVLRHGGAPHLRSPARDMNILQYHCLDVILFILGVVLVPIYILTCCVRKLWKKNRKLGGDFEKNKTD